MNNSAGNGSLARFDGTMTEMKPGDRHYMAYVGYPDQYDIMGASQFRLGCTLGLRAHHYLLDFGCGSLRAGRLYISYLDEGRYFGIEPNQWLIHDAIEHQIGHDVVRIKKPRFEGNSDFSTAAFGVEFDFITAQSIFTHAGSDVIAKALGSFRRSLKQDGIAIASFKEGAVDFGGTGWIYPGCVAYRPSTVRRMIREAGLFGRRIPWYSPRHSWYVLARDLRRLPPRRTMRHLTGAILFDPTLVRSWKMTSRGVDRIRRTLPQFVQLVPLSVKKRIRRLIDI